MEIPWHTSPEKCSISSKWPVPQICDDTCAATQLQLQMWMNDVSKRVWNSLKHFENVWNETFWKWPGKCLKWKALALTIFEMDSRQRAVHFHMISLIICLKRMAFHLFLWWLWGRWCQCFWGSWWYWQFCWHWNSCSYPNCQLPDIYILLCSPLSKIAEGIGWWWQWQWWWWWRWWWWLWWSLGFILTEG